MSKQNLTAWFFEGGNVSVPRRLLGLMEPLGLTFEDLGKMLYLLYCGSDQIKNHDRYAVEAARTLHSKGLIHWYTDTESVDFSPMFDKIGANLGGQSQYLADEEGSFTSAQLNYAQLIKKLEQTLGAFLNLRDKQNIQEVVQRYNWSYDLVYEIYKVYYQQHRKEYDFRFFCQMAYGAQVRDSDSLARFTENLNTTAYKTTEVMRKLGMYGAPSEVNKELYLKWTAQWKFSHEMIMRAVEETVGARNPSFKYVDAVLKEWQEREITSPEALEQAKQRQGQEKRRKNEPETGSQEKKPPLPKSLKQTTWT